MTTLQPVGNEHAPLLSEIHTASFGDAAWSLAQIEGSLALDTTRGWIAYEGDKAIGFILCQIAAGQIEILTFAVHPAMQHRGIGEGLLRKVTETKPIVENTRVFLEVAADNLAANRLYEKLGFQKTGMRPNYYKRGAMAVDAILYERILFEQ